MKIITKPVTQTSTKSDKLSELHEVGTLIANGMCKIYSQVNENYSQNIRHHLHIDMFVFYVLLRKLHRVKNHGAIIICHSDLVLKFLFTYDLLTTIS